MMKTTADDQSGRSLSQATLLQKLPTYAKPATARNLFSYAE